MKMEATTLAAFSGTEASPTASSSTLLTASLAVLIVGLPLSTMSFSGALKATIRKGTTINDWVSVFINYGIVQACLLGEMGTLTRLAVHLKENADVRVAYTSPHFSRGPEVAVAHAGLAAIAVFRCIYDFYPKLGFSFNAHHRYNVVISALLASVAVARTWVDYCYNKSFMHGDFEADQGISFKDMMSAPNFSWSMGYFFLLLACDFFLTVAIWNHVRSHGHSDEAADDTDNKQGQHNLLTIQATITCRMMTTVGNFAFLFFGNDGEDFLTDHIYGAAPQVFFYACITVCLPLFCILTGPQENQTNRISSSRRSSA